MPEKKIITFRGDKELWDKWVLLLRKNKIKIWDKLKLFIIKDIKNEK